MARIATVSSFLKLIVKFAKGVSAEYSLDFFIFIYSSLLGSGAWSPGEGAHYSRVHRRRCKQVSLDPYNLKRTYPN